MPLKRMFLERGMVQMMLKMPVFCLCVICLLIALCQLSPPESTFIVHRRIMTHFSLHTVSSTRSFDVIYDFIDAFQKTEQFAAGNLHPVLVRPLFGHL
jgi:hypothetical protein